jgi:hypothetical protein
MRPVLLFTCVLFLPVATGAQSGDTSDDVPAISDYAWGFPIEISEDASFYSVELPLEVNQSVTDPALRDAGVYNADGNPVSRMFEQADSDQEPVERSNPLPMLPLYQATETRTDDDKLSLQREGDSLQFKFDLEDLLAPEEDEKLVAYIVDSRQTDDNAAALDLVWGRTEPGFMGRVMVDGGNDLQNWSPIGSAVVAYLREESASIEQRRVRLRRGDYDFLRIRWEGLPDDWYLSQVMGVYMDGTADAVRKFITLDSTSVDPEDGGRIFELRGAPVVDQVRVVLPEPNTVISAQVFYWAERREQWLPISRGSYHHIIRNNNAVMSNPLKMKKTRTDRFKVVITRGPADVQMQMEVGWRPDRLLFLAQGRAPFTLATGSANDALRRFPQQRIYGGRSLAALAENNGGVVVASLGPRYQLGGPDRLIATKQINWRTFLLWFGMVLGVAFVGFMATKTIRELRAGSDLGN